MKKIKTFRQFSNEQSVNEEERTFSATSPDPNDDRYEADLAVMAGMHLGNFRRSLTKYQRRTTSNDWKKKIAAVIKDLDKLEDKFNDISTKLGIIPLK